MLNEHPRIRTGIIVAATVGAAVAICFFAIGGKGFQYVKSSLPVQEQAYSIQWENEQTLLAVNSEAIQSTKTNSSLQGKARVEKKPSALTQYINQYRDIVETPQMPDNDYSLLYKNELYGVIVTSSEITTPMDVYCNGCEVKDGTLYILLATTKLDPESTYTSPLSEWQQTSCIVYIPEDLLASTKQAVIITEKEKEN